MSNNLSAVNAATTIENPAVHADVSSYTFEAIRWEAKKATYMVQELQKHFNPYTKFNAEMILADHERISVKLDIIDGILGNIFELADVDDGEEPDESK